ncbi:spermidine synthase [Mycetohabitans sp. B5]|uniref:Spermidine synthase n=1 Tax=Mycetohabitans endofungorum TaxID=417203 RepID=A0A2P5KCF2_9BURK|nr:MULTISPECIES: spermidine synthase [Mycetohabitans]MCG1055488.1 spermidine synthase [Mycetohabitans sp. B5]PPB84335.1 spermidine synthase [Mycetohabitans endofungorum]
MTSLIKRASAQVRAFQRGEQAAQPSRGAARRTGRDEHESAVQHEGAPTLEAPRKARFAPVTFSEERGVRYLHFGTEWIQGAMRLKKPFDIELEYAQQMMAWLLFLAPPKRIVQLGLGAAALTKFCHRHFLHSHVEAVELNPAVIIAARSMFELPRDDRRLSVLQIDAWDFVHDPANHGTVGAMQIDLYDATARGPVLDSVAFYRACRACLGGAAVVAVNLFGDHPSFVRNMRHLRAAFDARVIALPEVHEGNRIVLAFSGPALSIDWNILTDRAKVIEKACGLSARKWVAALREASGAPRRDARDLAGGGHFVI